MVSWIGTFYITERTFESFFFEIVSGRLLIARFQSLSKHFAGRAFAGSGFPEQAEEPEGDSSAVLTEIIR